MKLDGSCPANQDRVYFESQVAETYEDWFECNLAACMLQATMRSIPSHMCRVGKPCQKSEFTCRVGKPSRGWKALSKIRVYMYRVGKPSRGWKALSKIRVYM